MVCRTLPTSGSRLADIMSRHIMSANRRDLYMNFSVDSSSLQTITRKMPLRLAISRTSSRTHEILSPSSYVNVTQLNAFVLQI